MRSLSPIACITRVTCIWQLSLTSRDSAPHELLGLLAIRAPTGSNPAGLGFRRITCFLSYRYGDRGLPCHRSAKPAESDGLAGKSGVPEQCKLETLPQTLPMKDPDRRIRQSGLRLRCASSRRSSDRARGLGRLNQDDLLMIIKTVRSGAKVLLTPQT